MEQLGLACFPPRIEGSGVDCIGLFLLQGAVEPGGAVSLQKTDIGQHDVTYTGQYDGEGRMWGTWQCGPDSGCWMIAMRRADDGAEGPEELEEIRPTGTAGGRRATRARRGRGDMAS